MVSCRIRFSQTRFTWTAVARNQLIKIIKSMTVESEFRGVYSRAVALSALLFGITHGTQFIVVSYIRGRSISVNLTSFFVVIPYEILQSLVLYLVGWILAYFPSLKLYSLLQGFALYGFASYVLSGAALGILAVPLSAAVRFLLLSGDDGPNFLACVVEFGLPMLAAGSIGGYTFWRRIRVAASNDETVANIFS